MSSSEIVTVPQSGVEKRVRVRLTEHRRGRTLNQPPYKHMTKRLRNQLGYQISPRRFGPPDAKSGQPTCVNASEQGTQENIRDESYLPERLAVP
ncbi:hypothetical protein T01_8165 [Trichinella spiralis]|uniref:Uncharacterized protein n=1 Tax=Trichinella spiralis TaxID=6334 RepID=A0A0V1BM03_TRISP|nr:hypothetical protein T01_8165 [Trichinella spiralis]